MNRTHFPYTVSLALLFAATTMGGPAHGQTHRSAYTPDRFVSLILPLASNDAGAPGCLPGICEPRALDDSVLGTPLPTRDSVALESDLAVLLAAQAASEWAAWTETNTSSPLDSQPSPAIPLPAEPAPDTLLPPPAMDEWPADDDDHSTFGDERPLPFDPETGRVYGYGPNHRYDVVVAHGDPGYDEGSAGREADLPFDPETGRVHGYGPDHQYDVVIGYPFPAYRDAIAWIRQLDSLQSPAVSTKPVSDFSITSWAMRNASRWVQSPVVMSALHWKDDAAAAAGNLFHQARQSASVRTFLEQAEQLAQQANELPPLPEDLDADLFGNNDRPMAGFADEDYNWYEYERFTADEAIERDRPAEPAPMYDVPMLNAALAINEALQEEVAAERSRQAVKRLADTLDRAGTALRDLSRYLANLVDDEMQPPFPKTANGERRAPAR